MKFIRGFIDHHIANETIFHSGMSSEKAVVNL